MNQTDAITVQEAQADTVEFIHIYIPLWTWGTPNQWHSGRAVCTLAEAEEQIRSLVNIGDAKILHHVERLKTKEHQ